MQPITADSVPSVSKEPWYQDAVAFWEYCFPGKEEALTNFLSPFYEIVEIWEKHQKPFPIAQSLLPTEDLERRCQKATFWQPWQGLVIIQDRAGLEDILRVNLKVSFWDSLRIGLRDSLLDILEVSPKSLSSDKWEKLRASLILSFWDRLERSLKFSLRDISGVNIRCSLRGFLGESVGVARGVSLVEIVVIGLWDSLFYACGFLIAGDEKKTEAFRELLGLWAEGVILFGFDNEGRLIIYSPLPEATE